MLKAHAALSVRRGALRVLPAKDAPDCLLIEAVLLRYRGVGINLVGDLPSGAYRQDQGLLDGLVGDGVLRFGIERPRHLGRVLNALNGPISRPSASRA